MKVNRFPDVLKWIALVILVNNCCAADYDSEPSQEDDNKNHPRFFGIFSRPKPEAPKQHGLGLKAHIGNMMSGGSIGFHAEFKPFAPVQGFVEHAKKMIPNPMDFIPNPKNFIPNPKDFIPGFMGGKFPKPDESSGYFDYDKIQNTPKPYPRPPAIHKPSGGKVESGTPEWTPESPIKPPNSNGPKWEDIGEDVEQVKPPKVDVPDWEDIGEGDDDPNYEGIIQPRLRRPKRFIESQVYHVPLEFVSNAKPYGVKIHGQNHT